MLVPAFSSAVPIQFNPDVSFNNLHFQKPEVLREIDQPVRGTVKARKRKPAAINRAALMVTSPSRIFYRDNGASISPELIADFNRMRAMEKPFDPAEMIPLDLSPTSDQSQVLSRVADRSMNSFLNSKIVRETYLVKTATEVEKKMNQEIVIGSGSGPESVQHKLNFNMQAFQATAKVEYSGLTNAAIKYKVDESKLALEIFEKVSSSKDLMVSHTISPSDRLSQVNFRWSF